MFVGMCNVHEHIPNMYRATFDHYVVYFYVHFGVLPFSMVKMALKCKK